MNNIVPGAVLFPGIFANYGAGIIRRWLAIIWHYTVGTNSLALIARNGLCAFLISPDGTIYQMAPWDSINYTQCEFNVIAQGIEVESLDGSITDAQISSLGYLTIFLINAGAIVPIFYDGPRIELSECGGVTNHRCLNQHACDNHFDGFGREIWDAIWTPTPLPEPELPKDGEMRLFHDRDNDLWCLWDGYNWNEGIPTEVWYDLLSNNVPKSDVSAATMLWLKTHVGQNVEAQIQRIASAVR